MKAIAKAIEKAMPDLVVEVVFTSGGVDKLTVYQRLQIAEVWIWQNDQLSIYSLREGKYQKVVRSELLPKLDLELLTAYILHPQPLFAVKEFRQSVRNSIP